MELPIENIYEQYNEVIDKMVHSVRFSDNKVVETVVFEDFHMGVLSFFHKSTLDRLQKAHLITQSEAVLANKVYHAVIELEKSPEWTIEAFRISDKWYHVLELIEQLKRLQATP